MNPSGFQIELAHGAYTAVVTEVGATLRELRHHDHALVVPFGADEIRPNFRGAVLQPWPNRVAGGAYTFQGDERQLPLTEPDRGNALHGLVAWARWQVAAQSADTVELTHQLVPFTGYPHPLDLRVRYALDDAGLHWTVAATNTGAGPAPYGTGPHPYLVAGAGRVDDWSLELPAAEYLAVTPDRLLPAGVEPVDSAGFDFRTPRRLGDIFIDHAFTALAPGADGVTRAVVRADDGRGVVCSWNVAECPWVQIHTADRPGEAGHRIGLAVEPMTCPPDAFNSGTDLVVLEPGQTHATTWTIAAL
ncbi:aldose 1-epimerase family protein [Jiangella sp. DSM 45060]|uniref:aldose 1-epimerase family protein n=1 Tax=Jiangella sp. DSM 45060 TaxID=1798224 RepID=UPI00087B7D9C|nr:aldose 1-epimerase family protein [Jiangella sp. DSM 45060]SDT59855.1 aldose 1-epimerase [Jiangella sp. DSM 45060]